MINEDPNFETDSDHSSNLECSISESDEAVEGGSEDKI